MTLEELLKRQNEIIAEMSTADKETREKLVSEYDNNKREIEVKTQQLIAKRNAEPKKVDVRENFRRELKDIVEKGVKREISLGTLTGSPNASIANSAEAQVTIVENPLPLVEPKTVYKALGIKSMSNVPSDKIIWPYATNAVELIERNEAEAAAEDVINWDKIKPTPYEASLVIKIDNEAIDNASFDIYGYALEQLALAKGRYLDKKIVSSASFKGLKGPFSGKATTTIDATWKNIKVKTAEVSGKNISMEKFCYIGNAMTTAILETTPKANGQGGFILENGKIGAYPYYETEYACYISTGAGTPESPYKYSFDSANAYLAFGPFNLLALVGHGIERLVADPVTLADKNQTRIIFHTKNSLTDLSTVDNAFRVFKLKEVTQS